MLDKIIPPDDPKKVTNWRWFVAIAVTLVALNAFAGRFGISGWGAYASEQTVQKQGEKIDRLLILNIATVLRDLQKEECKANGNKRILENTIEEYQEQYRELTSKRYPLPECDDPEN